MCQEKLQSKCIMIVWPMRFLTKSPYHDLFVILIMKFIFQR